MLRSLSGGHVVHKENGIVCVRIKEVAIKKSRIEFDVLIDENLCATEKRACGLKTCGCAWAYARLAVADKSRLLKIAISIFSWMKKKI